MTIQSAIAEYAKRRNLQPVTPAEFYRDMFPQGALDKTGEMKKGKYTAIIRRVNKSSLYLHDDLAALSELSQDDAAYISPIGYAGKCQNDKLARELYALVIRLNLPEDATGDTIRKTFRSYKCSTKHYTETKQDGTKRIVDIKEDTNPCEPTYLVASGKDLYLYYMLEYPVPMFENFAKTLETIKTYLSKQVHLNCTCACNREISKPVQKDIYNKYPAVGTMVAGELCQAYKVGRRWSVYDLNALVPKSKMLHYKPKGVAPKPTWVCSDKFYDSYIRRVEDNLDIALPGCLEALASYACKCWIDEEKYKVDRFNLYKLLSTKYTTQVLDEHQSHAKSLYEGNENMLKTWTVDYLEKITGIPIPRNKRNGRTQKQHLKMVHESMSKEQEIAQFRKDNPSSTIDDCVAALGISKKTVKKWWDKASAPAPTKRVQMPKVCINCNCAVAKKPERWPNKKNGNFYARTIYYCPECGEILHTTKARLDN